MKPSQNNNISTESGQKANEKNFDPMVTRQEKISYSTYFVGQNIFYIFLMIFLMPFFTDIGIPPSTVVIITLTVKVWDAINDPIFGGFVDKIKFKSGKFVPWLRISLFAIPIATILLFATPVDMSVTMKAIWVSVAYILWDTAYTICDVPIFGLITTITSNLRERTGLMAIGRVSGMCAALLVMIIVPSVREAIGGWFPTAVLLSVIGVILMVPICFTAKERVKPVVTDDEPSLLQLIGLVARNKYMLIFYGSVLITGSTAIGTTLSMYFSRYALGDEGLMSLVSLSVLFPTIVIGLFIQVLLKKYDKYTLYTFGLIGNIVMTIIAFFVGYQNFYLYILMQLLKGIPLGFTAILMFMFTPDCVEYGLYKSGIDASGISFSIQTFSAKFTSAIATAIGAMLLTFIGFIEGEGAAQLPEFASRLWLGQNMIPIIGCVLGLVLLLKYKLRDQYVQVMTRCNAGEISREEAEKQLENAKF